jgi:fucose permease
LAVLLLAGLPAISFPPSRAQESGTASAEQMEAGRAQAGRAEGGEIAAAEHAEAATVEVSRNPLKTTNWAYAAAGLFLVGSEGTLLGLMPAQSVTVSSSGLGGEVLALLLMTGMFVGRVAGTKLFAATTVGWVLSGSAATVTAAALLWSVVPHAAPVMLFLLGCATANLFPGTISHISETRPWAASATIAALGCTGGLGGTVVPALAGTALDLGLSVHLVSLFVIVPTVIAYALVRSVELSAAARPAR